MARVLFFLAAALAVLWLIPVSTAWRLAPDLGHAWAVPLLIAYLWWERWAERPAAISRLGPGSPPYRWLLAATALAVAVIGLPLRLLLTPFPLWPGLLAAFTVLFAAVAVGAAWAFAGRAGLRWVGGPLILVLSALPVPSAMENAIVQPLRVGMATLAAEISNLVGQPALALGTSVRLGGGWVGIDEACGGIRSLQACVMIGLFFGEWYRFGWRRRLVLLVAAIVSALLGNFLRVLVLSLLANAGPEAMSRAHDPAGWLAMGLSLVLTGWLACRWSGYRWPERQLLGSATRPALLATTRPLIAFLTVTLALLAVNEIATRVWFARGLRERQHVQAWSATLPTHDPSFQAQPLAEAAAEMLRPDLYAAGRWRAGPDTFVSAYYIEWRRGQVARSVPFLHNPTVCLPLAGCELVGDQPPIEISVSAATLPFKAYKFRRSGQEMLVAFTIWDTARGQPLVRDDQLGSWQNLWRPQWTEVREAREHQPAQLLTVTVPWSEGARDLAQETISRLVQPLSID